MLPIENLINFDLIKQNRSKYNKRFHGNQNRQN